MAENPSEQDHQYFEANTDTVTKHGATYADLKKISYTWTIHNFSFLQKETGDSLFSPIFSTGAYKWQLRIYPNGDKTSENGYLSLYLKFVRDKKSSAEARFRMYILNDKKQKINVEPTSPLRKFETQNLAWGWRNFAKKSFLQDVKNRALPDDSLTVSCGISIVEGTSELNHSEESKEPECSVFDYLSDFFGSADFSDVTLITPSREFQAHKLILAMRSPVFSAMFKSDMLEQKENRVDIADVDDVVLMELLRFIYTGKIINLDKMAEGLLAAADKYQLKSLKALCEKSLIKGLTIETAASQLILGDLHSCVQLKAQALVFICEHINDIFETTSYKSMCDTHPYLLHEILQAFAAPKALSGSTIVARS